MLLRIAASLTLLGHVSCFGTPARAGASSPSAAAAPFGRRQAVTTAFSAAAVLFADGANAYDTIPQMEPDFAAMEIKRQERMAKSNKKTAELNKKLKAMQDAGNAKAFIDAADDMALWVITEQSGARRARRIPAPLHEGG